MTGDTQEHIQLRSRVDALTGKVDGAIEMQRTLNASLDRQVAELRRIVDTLANRVRELDARTFHNAPGHRAVVVTDELVNRIYDNRGGTWQHVYDIVSDAAAYWTAQAGADTDVSE